MTTRDIPNLANQLKGNMTRILIEKKRQKLGSFCELFSHIFILSFVCFAYFVSEIKVFPSQKHDQIQAFLPKLQQNANPSIIQSFNDYMSGPLRIPNFDEYIEIGKALKPYLERYRSVLALSANGKSLSNLISPGPLIFAPRGTLVDSFLLYMNHTYREFSKIKIILFNSKQQAIRYIKKNSKTQVFALISIQFSGQNGSEGNQETFFFEIRQSYGAVPSTNQIISSVFSGFIPDYQQYFLSGFLTLQQSFYLWVSNMKGINIPDISRIMFTPYPSFEVATNMFYTQFGGLLPIFLILSTSYPLVKFSKSLVDERENGIFQLMSVMGLNRRVYYFTWILFEGLVLIVIAVSYTILVHFTFWSKSSMWLLLANFLLFVFSGGMLALIAGMLLNNSQIVSVFIPASLLILSLPYFVLSGTSQDELFAIKVFLSLSSPTAFAFASLIILNLESANIGLQDVNYQYGKFNFSICLWMLFLDIVLYFLLWLLLVSLKGRFVSSLYNFRLFSNHTPFSNSLFNADVESIDERTMGQKMLQLRNLGKQFSNGCCALRSFSLDLYEGQIACLLGSNGAGNS